MKSLKTLALASAGFSLLAESALAHPGHVEAVAGHSHWPALAALGAAVVVAAVALARRLRRAGSSAAR